jgi:hypothetical protein
MIEEFSTERRICSNTPPRVGRESECRSIAVGIGELAFGTPMNARTVAANIGERLAVLSRFAITEIAKGYFRY